LPEKEFPTVEYPKDAKELIIRQWDRVLKLVSSGSNPIEAVDWLEVVLSDKVDNPNDDKWKRELEVTDNEYKKVLKSLSGKLNTPVNELDIRQKGEELTKYYKRRGRVLWKLSEAERTLGMREVEGVISEFDEKTLREIMNGKKQKKKRERKNVKK